MYCSTFVLLSDRDGVAPLEVAFLRFVPDVQAGPEPGGDHQSLRCWWWASGGGLFFTSSRHRSMASCVIWDIPARAQGWIVFWLEKRCHLTQAPVKADNVKTMQQQLLRILHPDCLEITHPHQATIGLHRTCCNSQLIFDFYKCWLHLKINLYRDLTMYRVSSF